MTQDADLWVRGFVDRPQAALRLVCFPHAGGSASYFRPLAVALSADIEPVALQYPGRQDRRREAPLTSIAELADAVVQVLGDDPRRRPTVFLGHSMGATLAFEVIRRYERAAGGTPLGLIASGRRAPSIPNRDHLRASSDDVIMREMRSLNGTDAKILDDPDVQEMILPVLRADYTAIETYQFDGGAPIGVPIHAFIGDSDPRIPVEESRAWERHTSAGFRFAVFPGGHFYLGEMPAAKLAAEVEQSVRAFAALAPAALA